MKKLLTTVAVLAALIVSAEAQRLPSDPGGLYHRDWRTNAREDLRESKKGIEDKIAEDRRRAMEALRSGRAY